jgi:hypothetical protein
LADRTDRNPLAHSGWQAQVDRLGFDIQQGFAVVGHVHQHPIARLDPTGKNCFSEGIF